MNSSSIRYFWVKWAMKFLLLQTPTRNVAASGSTSRERRVERQLHRRNTGFQGQHHRRVIFASLPSSMRRFTPTPSKVK